MGAPVGVGSLGASLDSSPPLHPNAHLRPPPQHELSNLADRSATCFPYSTYSLSCNLAKNVGGWDAEWISEDWHMFLKCFLQSGGVCTVRTCTSANARWAVAVAAAAARRGPGLASPTIPPAPDPLSSRSARRPGAPDFPPDRELHPGGHDVVGHDLGALGAGQAACAGHRRDGLLPEPAAGRVHEQAVRRGVLPHRPRGAPHVQNVIDPHHHGGCQNATSGGPR